MSVWAIIVAAGTGSRFGGAKQFEQLGTKRVVDWSLEVVREVVNGVVVVTSAGTGMALDVDAVVAGGDTRSASVRAGLAAVPDDAEIVVVHDAARPFASKTLWQATIDAVRNGAAAAIPGLPVVDTLKRVASDNRVVETVDRSELVSVQTPQAFRSSDLRRAHRLESDATDDAGLVEVLGGSVVVVRGEAHNFKITVPEDLAFAQVLVQQQLVQP